MEYERLKARHRAERDGFPQALSLRLHRALSWLRKAEGEEEDPDGRFISLWIAFNAAYATDLAEREDSDEQSAYRNFLERVIRLDTGKRIAGLVWKEYPGSIRLLLDNPYVFPPFWRFQNGLLSRQEWENQFANAKRKANGAWAASDTTGVLVVVLRRLYTLRNQLIHGGATWGSTVNRSQVRDCMNLLGKLVPIVIELMMDAPEEDWGKVPYPVVDAEQDSTAR